jgi:hypothetical protein
MDRHTAGSWCCIEFTIVCIYPLHLFGRKLVAVCDTTTVCRHNYRSPTKNQKFIFHKWQFFVVFSTFVCLLWCAAGSFCSGVCGLCQSFPLAPLFFGLPRHTDSCSSTSDCLYFILFILIVFVKATSTIHHGPIRQSMGTHPKEDLHWYFYLLYLITFMLFFVSKVQDCVFPTKMHRVLHALS